MVPDGFDFCKVSAKTPTAATFRANNCGTGGVFIFKTRGTGGGQGKE